MRLEIERKTAIDGVTDVEVRDAIMSLRSYGSSSFASLTDEVGNYVQVAGGGVTCMLERRDSNSGRHFRGYKQEKHKIFPDGTILAFGGGEIRLLSDEWFTAGEVAEIFSKFLHSGEFLPSVCWRDMTRYIAG